MCDTIMEFFNRTVEMRLWVICFTDFALILSIIVTAVKTFGWRKE